MIFNKILLLFTIYNLLFIQNIKSICKEVNLINHGMLYVK